MELVDGGKNGYYANYPSIVRKIFSSMNKEELHLRGLEGYKKAKTIYDIKLTCRTIEKSLMGKLFETKKIKKIPSFYKQLPYHPSKEEIKTLRKDYFAKLSFAESENKVSSFEKLSFRLMEKLWCVFDFVFLAFRYILRYFRTSQKPSKKL